MEKELTKGLNDHFDEIMESIVEMSTENIGVYANFPSRWQTQLILDSDGGTVTFEIPSEELDGQSEKNIRKILFRHTIETLENNPNEELREAVSELKHRRIQLELQDIITEISPAGTARTVPDSYGIRYLVQGYGKQQAKGLLPWKEADRHASEQEMTAMLKTNIADTLTGYGRWADIRGPVREKDENDFAKTKELFHAKGREISRKTR